MRKRLLKLNLLESFDQQLNNDIQNGFCEILKGEQVAEILSKVHCCSTINFVLKPSSESTPLRIVTNASFFHQSKSLNQNAIPGLTELPPIQHLLIEFFLSPFIACFDISKCYRAIFTSEATNLLRIIPIWVDQNDSDCTGILKFSRMCFGDVAASSILLLSYSHFVLPLLKSPLARKVLSSLYVDDSLSGHRSKEKLEEAVDEVIEKLAVFGFKPKFVYFNWKPPPPEVTDDVLVVFHQKWNILTDQVTPQA